MTEKTLASIVSVARRFQRSTKIDADYNSPEALSGFVLQTSGLNAVNTIADFYQKSTQRAFTLTGPYGSGKSSLALFFSSLLTGSDPVRAEALSILKAAPEAAESGLAAFGKEKPWRFVSLLGHRASLADDFLKAIHAEGEDVRTAIEALVAGTKTGDGVLLIIDELGKYLENGNSDNCFFLQELAEAVNRSDSRIIVLGILHQAFSAYAADLSKLERDEWAKVQGRFVDIPLLAGPDEILQLLCRSIVCAELPEIEGLEACVDLVVNELAKHPLKTPSGKIEIYSEQLAKIAETWTLPKGDVITALPKFVRTWEMAGDAKAKTYPLQCYGYHGHGRVHSSFHNLPWVREAHPDRVLVNPVKAEERGLFEGQKVRVFNDRGAIEIAVHITPRIIPGVCALPQGAWYRPVKKNGKTVDVGGCINTLTSPRPSPLAKGNPSHTNLVQIEPISA